MQCHYSSFWVLQISLCPNTIQKKYLSVFFFRGQNQDNLYTVRYQSRILSHFLVPKRFFIAAESDDAAWAGEEDFVLVEATESGSAECSAASSGSEAASRPCSLPLSDPPPDAAPPAKVRYWHFCTALLLLPHYSEAVIFFYKSCQTVCVPNFAKYLIWHANLYSKTASEMASNKICQILFEHGDNERMM